MDMTYTIESGVVTRIAKRRDRADTTVVERTYWYTRRDPQEVRENEARIVARRARERSGFIKKTAENS